MTSQTVGDADIPALGVGTWQLTDADAYEAVTTALDVGYRHVDTAQVYDNEWAVGRAIADSDVPREDVFLTTKVDPFNRSREAIETSLTESLSRLGVDAVDLLLIHWPNPLADLRTVMETLSELQERGLTHHIGVSNFGADRLDRAREYASVPIAANQVLFHPFHPQRELLSYCQNHDVTLTAYSPLAEGSLIADTELAEIGTRYDATAAQVALRWATQHENVVAIPKSTSRDHLAENLASLEFTLSAADHDRITRPSLLRTAALGARARVQNLLSP